MKGKTLKAIGIGDCKIVVQTSTGDRDLVNLILHGVLYVPEARRNLWSTSELAQDQFQVVLLSTYATFCPKNLQLSPKQSFCGTFHSDCVHRCFISIPVLKPKSSTIIGRIPSTLFGIIVLVICPWTPFRAWLTVVKVSMIFEASCFRTTTSALTWGGGRQLKWISPNQIQNELIDLSRWFTLISLDHASIPRLQGTVISLLL